MAECRSATFENFSNFGVGPLSKTFTSQISSLKCEKDRRADCLNASLPLCEFISKVSSLFGKSDILEKLTFDKFSYEEANKSRDVAIQSQGEPGHHCNIPIYSETEKFDKSEKNRLNEQIVERECWEDVKVKESNTKVSKLDTSNMVHICGPSKNLCKIEFHSHPENKKTGLLQICCGTKKEVRYLLDNEVREMDKMIENPETNICKDVMESWCKLELPGPYTFATKTKKVYFNSKRDGVDVLGLLAILIDTIYAKNCVSYVMLKGKLVPIELTQDVVKIIALIQKTFPAVFQELQKLLMYSTVTSLLKKIPFKWSRCMIHVLEDLLLHPLSCINDESVEFKLLAMIIRKRAKYLFANLDMATEYLHKTSNKHRNTIASHFTRVHEEVIESFFKGSADNCKRGHRVKTVKYLVENELFEKTLRDIFESYC